MRFALIAVAAFFAVDPWGWDSYGPLRFALISAMSLLAVAGWLGSGERATKNYRWASVGWLGFGAAAALATVTAPDRWHALVGTPERHYGLVTILLCGGLFLAVQSSGDETDQRVQTVLSASAGVFGAWAALELLDVRFFDSTFELDRAGGPFHQPAFLGAAALLTTPAALSRSFAETAGRRILWLACSAGGVFALIASQARAAWVGAAVAMLLVGWQYSKTATRQARRRLGVGLAASGLAVSVALWILDLFPRLWSVVSLSAVNQSGRFDEWKVAWRALSASPKSVLVGYGPEGYRTQFGRHVDLDYVVQYGRSTITDRAHSGPLDVALMVGIPGAVAYTLLLVGLVTLALQTTRTDPANAGLGVSVIAFVVAQLALFPLSELDPVFWILAGLLVRRASPIRQVSIERPRVSPLLRTGMLATGSLAAIALIAGFADLRADHAVASSILADQAEAEAWLDTARSVRPDSIRYDFISARTVMQRTQSATASREAIERIRHGLELASNDPALRLEHGRLMLNVARLSDDPSDVLQAIDILSALDRIEPNHPEVQQNYGIALALSGRPSEALDELMWASKLAPASIEPLLNLAVVQFESGAIEDGERTLDRLDKLAPSNAASQALRREFLSQ